MELFSSSWVNCVWRCKLLMCSGSFCGQVLCTIKTSWTWRSQTWESGHRVDLGFVLVKVESYLLICRHVLEDLL